MVCMIASVNFFLVFFLGGGFFLAQYVCPKSEAAMYDMHIAFHEFRYIYIYIYV